MANEQTNAAGGGTTFSLLLFGTSLVALRGGRLGSFSSGTTWRRCSAGSSMAALHMLSRARTRETGMGRLGRASAAAASKESLRKFRCGGKSARSA